MLRAKHDMIFARQEGLNVTTVAIVSFTADETDVRKPIDILIDAVTKWVHETKEGKQCWAASMEDLNIGDLSCFVMGDDLGAYGVYDFKAETCDTDNYMYYDRHLVDTHKLEKLKCQD